jgi:AFG3 family protein
MEQSRKQPDQRKRGGLSIFWFYPVILLIIGFLFINTMFKPVETTWPKFKKDMLLENDVEKIDVVNKEIAEVYIKQESLKKDKYKDVSSSIIGRSPKPGPHYYFPIGSLEVFEQQLEAAQSNMPEANKVTVTYSKRENWWSNILSWVLPLVLIFVFWTFISRRLSSGMTGKANSIFDFGKTKAEEYGKGKLSPVTFKDVAGYEEAKTEVMEVVEFLKHPEHFTKLGAKIPKGILMVGASGTGKTHMAKAVAGEAGVPFFSLSGSEFIEMFVGVGASRVRDLFIKAKEKAPSIIFIDEIDTIGKIRGKAISIQANDERDSTLNQLLAEMDGFAANAGVIVMAATNRADILDPALLRPGRFDRHIYLELPNKTEREAIFKVHLKPLITDKSLDIEILAAQTPGFSGADIANVCNEAALIAARNKKDRIEKEDFSKAIDRLVGGLEKKSTIISPAERNVIAYHEAGHAITSWMLKHVDPLQKVSIIPRGKSLGGAWYLPEERKIISRTQFMENLSVALGGRTAEEIIFKEASSGALDDLEKSTKLAYTMVANLGMSEKVGSLSFYDSTGVSEGSFQKPYSEATAKLIDDEVRKFIEDAHQHTRNILMEHQDKLDKLAKLLLEKEVVYKEDLEKLLGKREIKEKELILDGEG